MAGFSLSGSTAARYIKSAPRAAFPPSTFANGALVRGSVRVFPLLTHNGHPRRRDVRIRESNCFSRDPLRRRTRLEPHRIEHLARVDTIIGDERRKLGGGVSDRVQLRILKPISTVPLR
jgi:hypothetical protein